MFGGVPGIKLHGRWQKKTRDLPMLLWCTSSSTVGVDGAFYSFSSFFARTDSLEALDGLHTIVDFAGKFGAFVFIG